jgi:replicative DNA helicase
MSHTLPFSLPSETALAGSFLIAPYSIDSCQSEGVDPDSFLNPKLRAIAAAAFKIHADNEVPEHINTAEYLIQHHPDIFPDFQTALQQLNELTDKIQTTANLPSHIRTVREKQSLRAIILQATTAIEKAYDQEESPEAISATLTENMGNAIGQGSKTLKTAKEMAEIVYGQINELREGNSEAIFTPTGLRNIDKICGGFQESQLVIIAARPSVGKSSIILRFIEENSLPSPISDRKPRPGVLFSLEMTSEQMTHRLIAHHSRVPFQRYTDRLCGPTDTEAMVKSVKAVARAPIHFEDAGYNDVFRIMATSRALKRRHDIQYVIVDYLQIITPPNDKNMNVEQKISVISRNLKALSRELKIPVIVLAQLNRDSEREKRRPKLSDLRDSGSIEQDADVVILLSKNDETGENITADIAKYRNGPTGATQLYFRKPITRFEDADMNHANQ